MKANKNKGVGTISALSFSEASRIAYGTDKTIAHTNRQYLKVSINNEDWIYL